MADTRLESNDADVQGEFAKGRGLHVEKVSHLTNTEDHEEGVVQAIKNQPWVVAWSASGTVIGIPQFRKDFGTPFGGDYVLPAKWQSAYNGAPVASAVIGSLGAGAIADRYGRKWALFICYIFVYIAITLETVSTTNEIFFAGKFMAGFAVGGFITTSMTYIGEISPLALRGVLTAAAAISFTIGPLIVALVVNVTGTKTDRWAYRTIFVSQYGVNTLGALFLPFMPESPWWLVGQQKMDKAARALSRLGYDALNVEKRIAVISVTLEEIRKETDGASYIECFRKSNLRRTIISAAPLSIQALCGVLFIASYSTYYQQLAGYSTEESFTLAIVQQILAMSGNIVSWFLIDRVGRRDLTLWGMITLTILLTVTGGLAVSATPSAIKGTVALLLLYNFVYNATIGATAYSLLTEIATSRLRAKTASMALSLQNGLFTLLAFVLPFLFNPDQANLGAKVSFIFGGLSVFCTVYIWFYQPETAGRSYEELDELFIKKVPARKFKGYKTDVEIRSQEAIAENEK